MLEQVLGKLSVMHMSKNVKKNQVPFNLPQIDPSIVSITWGRRVFRHVNPRANQRQSQIAQALVQLVLQQAALRFPPTTASGSGINKKEDPHAKQGCCNPDVSIITRRSLTPCLQVGATHHVSTIHGWQLELVC